MIDTLRDFHIVFAKDGDPRTAELDRFVHRLLDKKLIAAERSRYAIRDFRAAVMTAAWTARSVELTEKGYNTVIESAEQNHQTIDKLQRGLRQLDQIEFKIVPPDQIGNVLAVQRDRKALETTLAQAGERYRRLADGGARNWRNTDIFRRTFVNNLAFEWKRLTVAAARKADLARFVAAAFVFVEIECAEPARYLSRRF